MKPQMKKRLLISAIVVKVDQTAFSFEYLKLVSAKLIDYKGKQAQLGVPHSEMQVYLEL